MSEHNEKPFSPEINNLLISLWDYENANGSFPPSELREFAAYVGKNLGRLKTEREMFIYWLLQAYEAIKRAEFEPGKTFDEISSDLVSVLANAGYDPNNGEAAKELLNRPEAFHIDKALELWSAHK